MDQWLRVAEMFATKISEKAQHGKDGCILDTNYGMFWKVWKSCSLMNVHGDFLYMVLFPDFDRYWHATMDYDYESN